MLQFIETICYENGEFQRVVLHEERMNRTRQYFFGLKERLSLEDALAGYISAGTDPCAGTDLQSVPHDAVASAVADLQSATNPPRPQKLKCRLTYSETIESIEFESYTPRVIQSLQLVYNDTIDYGYKYKDRSALNALLKQRGAADEILIVKCGLVTDTSYSNIVFLKEGKWYTPKAPLLSGTRRNDYLRRKLIFPLDISPEEIGQFEEARLINAMLSLEEAAPIKIECIYW